MFRILPLLLLCACASARFGGQVALDGRAFLQPAAVEGQEQGSGPSVMANPSFSIQSENRRHTATLQPFVRADLQDSQRTHLDLRQADYVFASDHFELGFGVGIFSWGSLEAFRAVDIVNQVDLVESPDGRSKLGQPYARLALVGNNYTLEALALPVHRPRTYPGEAGRLRGSLPVDEEPLYDQEFGALFPSAALRLSGIVGDFDLALSAFSGIARDPRFFVQLTDSRVNASYERLHHVAVDAQWTHEKITLKVEALARLWSEDHLFSFAAGLGIERTFFDLGGKDFTLLLEYHLDNRGPEQPFTIYDNDVFAGMRLAFNDEGDTTLSSGVVVDLATGMTYLRVQAARRLHDHWKLTVGGYGFFGPAGRLESGLLADHFLEGRIAYHF